jgi:hypothetical protein
LARRARPVIALRAITRQSQLRRAFLRFYGDFAWVLPEVSRKSPGTSPARIVDCRNDADGWPKARGFTMPQPFSDPGLEQGVGAVKPERIRVLIEVLDDGRMQARSPDHGVLAMAEDLEDLRRRVDAVVRARYGDNVRIALMVGRPT